MLDCRTREREREREKKKERKKVRKRERWKERKKQVLANRYISFTLLFCCGSCGLHGGRCGGCLDAHEHHESILFIFYQ